MNLRVFYAKLLAAAIQDLFPTAEPSGGGSTQDGFYHDFVFPFVFQEEMLPSIEEKMRFILFEKRPTQIMEMVPASAEAFFKHLGLEREIPKDEPLLKVIQIGPFADICNEKCTYNPTLYFKLLHTTNLEDGTRIVGAAFETKEELKEFVKEWKGSRCHRRLGLELDLFSSPEEGLWMWHPKGEKARQALARLWKQEHIEKNFHLISTPSLTEEARLLHHAEINGRTAEIGPLFLPLGKEGMLTPKRGFVDHAFCFCSPEKITAETISSLQFILKILNICGFDYEVILSSKAEPFLISALKECPISYQIEEGGRNRIEFRLSDGLGRRWTGPYIQLDMRHPVLYYSLFCSMERFFALLLENDIDFERLKI